MMFDTLIYASAKVVKDFVSYLYTNLKFVYKSLKAWLLKLQGKFIQHDSFVDMVYGFMDDVEEFEWEAQIDYHDAHLQLALAQQKLESMQNAKGPLPEWPQPMRPLNADPIGPPTLIDGEVLPDPIVDKAKFTSDQCNVVVQNAFDEAEVLGQTPILCHAKLKVCQVEDEIKEKYALEKGELYLGRFFNTLAKRMDYVKRCASRRLESSRLAAKVQKQVFQVENVPDFESMCIMEEVATGETKEVKGGKDEDEPKTINIKKWVRRLRLDDPVVQRDACKFIRRHVVHHNCRLSSDEVSVMTINRYVSQFCDLMKLDQNSTEYLMRAAMVMVPIVTKQDLATTMVIHSPAARDLRAMKDTVESAVFLDGLCHASGFESPFSILGLPDIVVRTGAVPRKSRSVISYLSQFSLGLDFRVPNPSLHNALVAVERRVFTVGKGTDVVLPLVPSHGIFNKLAYFRDSIIKEVGFCKVHSPMALAMTYQAQKRTQYIHAVLSLRRSPIQVKDSFVTAFLKMEKHWLCKDIAPRLICPRSKRYNVELGRRLKFAEKKFMHAIDNVFGSPTVLSGYDNFKVGQIIARKWGMFRRPVAIGVDASRFDQHVSKAALKFEHSIYNGVFGDPQLKELLKWQTTNKVSLFVEDKMLRFKVVGHRMSGDINTAMGNKLIMCAMMHNYFRELEVKAELCNNGDDCDSICEQEDEWKFSRMSEWFNEYGFNMKVEAPVYVLESLEFCQSHPVKIGGSYRMVRRPDSISKDAHSMLSMRNKEDVKSFISATGQCGMILNSGVPILDAYHNALYRASGYKKVSEEYIQKVISYGTDERLQGRRTRVEEPVTMENRLSYWHAFGVDPQTQVLVERYFNDLQVSIELRGVKIVTPLLQSILLNIPQFKPPPI
uniref:RNA-directed RNA polymerase n=2 Tax=Cherry-associated luteovirus TaxID=1912598 RepID=A0A1Y0B8I3_9TOMB|nr:RNA-dependent RNA polymerase P1-P2 fusion protein [Cherry-associated luteovirus]